MRKYKKDIDGLTPVQRWCKNNPEEHRASVRRSIDKLHAAVLALLGNKCNNLNCRYLNVDGTLGCTNLRLLQVDHINGGGSKEQRKLGGPDAVWRKILKMDNPEFEYQLLCANCNWEKRYVKQEVTGAPKKWDDKTWRLLKKL